MPGVTSAFGTRASASHVRIDVTAGGAVHEPMPPPRATRPARATAADSPVVTSTESKRLASSASVRHHGVFAR